MRFAYSALLLSSALGAAAFPSLESRETKKAPPFDPKDQLVDVTGKHAWKAPGPHDVRGPCPGLNAMANHGYLPHNGFATIPEFIHACKTVFRMGTDLASILAAYGAAIDGAGVGWSIGGKPHIGIGGSHNNYESDSSPLRGDLNQYGSNSELIMSQFHELYNMQPNADTANYDLELLKKFRGRRFNESIAKNPDFYYAPFSGAVVSQAAFTFIYRFMANKSAEHPMGKLDKNVLKSFMSIQGPEDDLKWIPGHERIPDHWYTRNKKDPYNIAYFGKDTDYFVKGQEFIAQAGCNRGKVNSFVTIDVTAGKNETAKPLCVGLAYALEKATSLGLVDLVLQEAIIPAQNALGCDTVPKLDTSIGKACPGYSFYGGPTGKVAKGAIQH